MSSDESASNSQQQQVVSVSTRRLNSFSPPDLEVLVGPKQRIYRYHALILASYSTYVDTILSSPMAVQNQQEKRVNFPDIPEETWEAIISYLEPGGNNRLNTSEKVQAVLPFYDKYQFTDGITMCDSWISKLLQLKGSRYHGCAPLAVMAFDLNLPTAKPVAAAWAAKVFEIAPDKASTIKMLLPLVENNDKVLKNLVRTIKGRHYQDMTIDEIRKLTKEESFPADIVLKTKQIYEMEEILKRLIVKSVHIHLPRDGDPEHLIGGDYSGNDGPYYDNDGAFRIRRPMRHGFTRNNSEGDVITIQALDGFGRIWEISASPQSDVDSSADERDLPADVQSTRRVLHRWDCGYSSIFSPQHGWKTVEVP